MFLRKYAIYTLTRREETRQKKKVMRIYFIVYFRFRKLLFKFNLFIFENIYFQKYTILDIQKGGAGRARYKGGARGAW